MIFPGDPGAGEPGGPGEPGTPDDPEDTGDPGNPGEPGRVEGVQELLVDQGNFSKDEQRLNPAYNDGRGLDILEDIKVGHQNCQKSQKSEAQPGLITF